jgi:hypothetical protein
LSECAAGTANIYGKIDDITLRTVSGVVINEHQTRELWIRVIYWTAVKGVLLS